MKEGNEIDLVNIFAVCWRKIRRFFAIVYSAILWCVRFAYAHKGYMVLAALCALAFTLYWARPKNRNYQMDSEMRINVLDAYFFNDVISSINHMCENKDTLKLKQVLGVSPEAARTLGSIQSFYIVDLLCDDTPDEICRGEYVADTTKQIMNDRLSVRIVVKDTSLVDELTQGLLRYFTSNTYVNKMNTERLAQIDGRINTIDKEILMLDSLRKHEYFKKGSKEYNLDGPLIVSEKTKQLYYGDILTLEKDRNKKSFERVVSSRCVDFIREFTLVKVLNGYVVTMALSLAVFVVFFFLVALFMDKKSKINSFLTNK